jgi:hypothetical protein
VIRGREQHPENAKAKSKVKQVKLEKPHHCGKHLSGQVHCKDEAREEQG